MKNTFKILSVIQILYSSVLFSQPLVNNPEIEKNDTVNIIRGILSDSLTGKELEYAHVGLYKKSDKSILTGTISLPDGRFSLENINNGNYYLLIEYLGYQKKIIDNITVSEANRKINLRNIKLQPDVASISEVNVEAERNYVDYKVDKKVVNVSSQPNAGASPLSEVLKSTPGITTDNNGNILLRGSSNFILLIDGKPSPLATSDQLGTIPASMVENVEIITNPSSKYDAQGSAGIINVKMKNVNNDGISGIARLSAGTKEKYGANFLTNVRKKKVNVSVGADYDSRWNYAENNFDRFVHSANYQYDLYDYTKMKYQRKKTSLKSGIEYNINKNNSVTLSEEGGRFNFNRKMDVWYREQSQSISNAKYSVGHNEMGVESNYLTSNLAYSHKFNKPDHDLSASIYYAIFDVASNNIASLSASDNNWNEQLNTTAGNSNNQDGQGHESRLKIDYKLPIGNKSKFETGVQTSLRSILTNNIYSDDSIISKNTFDFYRNIYAAYVTYSGAILGFEYLAGLRSETTDRMITDINNTKYGYLKTEFFPSFFITRKVSEAMQIQLSYSRRINRPQEYNLKPIEGYSDVYSAEKGNPLLMPETVGSYEFNVQHRIKKGNISLGIYYRNTSNSMQRVNILDEKGRICYSFDNFDNTQQYGSEININYVSNKILTINSGIDFYGEQLDGTFEEENVNTTTANCIFRISPAIKISKSTRTQLSFNYQSPGNEPAGRREGSYSADISIKQDFLKRKLSLSLNVFDVFNTAKYVVTTKSTAYDSHLNWKNEGQIVMLSLSYNFNNFQNNKIKFETEEINL